MTASDDELDASVGGSEGEQDGDHKEGVPWKGALPLFKRFYPYLRAEKRRATWVALLLLLSVPSGVISPFLVRYLFDDVLATEPVDLDALLQVSSIMIGLTLFSGVLRYVQALISIALHNRVRFRVMQDLVGHVLRLPLRYYHGTETGYLMSRIRDDVRALDPIMLDDLVEAAFELLKAVLFLGILLFLDVGLALSGLALIAAILVLVLAVSPALRRRSEIAREADAKSSAALHQAIAGIQTVRTAAQEPAEKHRYASRLKNAIRAAARREVLGALTGTAFGMIGMLGVYVIVAVGAWRISEGESSFGNLFAFFMFLMQLMTSTGAVFALVPSVQAALASLQRIQGVLDEQPESAVAGSSPPAGGWSGEIEFRGVRFRYEEGGALALDGVDLVVRPGEVVALVGRSGAGKSTLANLIPRLYDPEEGEVLLDGTALPALPLDWLRARIGVVPQDVFLFDRTVRENIAYAAPQATEEQIAEAARAAHAASFVEQLPDGLDTVVGERGVRLSGGEKQRLAIARELLRDPPILIFDEATSSLDVESEALVREATRRLMRGRTCLVIAHRLSTIQNVDRIVVLDEGRVVAQGTHAALLEEGGLYQELYEMQFQEDGADGEEGPGPPEP